jgi:TPR repeat protein
VERDIDEAIKWYKMAAAQGNARAKENLKKLLEIREP